jgi:host factor-I protein
VNGDQTSSGGGAGRSPAKSDGDAPRPRERDALQTRFLDAVIAGRVPMAIFLVNGVRIEGRITAYDQFSVLVEKPGAAPNAVYKSAISTMTALAPLEIEGDGWAQGAGQRAAQKPGRGGPHAGAARRPVTVERLPSRRIPPRRP